MGLAWVWVPALAWVIRIAHADAALDVTPEAESEQDDFGLLQTNLISGMHLKGDEAIKSESGIGVEEEQRDAAVFTLFPLPYDYNGLEPFIDTETMFYHHDKHHQTYIDKLNAEIEGDLSAADVISWSTLLVNILKSTGAEDTVPSLCWRCLEPLPPLAVTVAIRAPRSERFAEPKSCERHR